MVVATVLVTSLSVPSFAEKPIEDDTPQINSHFDANTHSLVDCDCLQYSAFQLESVMQGTMKEYAWEYYDECQKTRLCPTFKIAVDSIESAWGEAREAQNTNNLSGFMSGYMLTKFDSFEQCIQFTTAALRLWYLTNPKSDPEPQDWWDVLGDKTNVGGLFKGDTIDAVNKSYNGRHIWSSTIKSTQTALVEKLNDPDSNSDFTIVLFELDDETKEELETAIRNHRKSKEKTGIWDGFKSLFSAANQF